MNKRKAFTLIELLVVIAIIALLLSILMPSLGKAKEIAKRVVCQATIKQLGFAGLMYTADNNDSFHVGYAGNDSGVPLPEHMWMDAFRPYYGNGDVRVCPSTKKPVTDSDGQLNGLPGDPSLMWGIFPTNYSFQRKGDYGSYGFNAWLNNPSSAIVNLRGVYPTVNHFRKVTGARGSTDNIPVFVDSNYVHGYPTHVGFGSEAPAFDGLEGYGMGRFCNSRHKGNLSAVFLDGSARSIGVKELWKLKWHKNFETNFRYYPDIERWPDWMSKYKD